MLRQAILQQISPVSSRAVPATRPSQCIISYQDVTVGSDRQHMRVLKTVHLSSEGRHEACSSSCHNGADSC